MLVGSSDTEPIPSPMVDVCAEIAVSCLCRVLDGDVLVKIGVGRLGQEDRQMVKDAISDGIRQDGCKI